LRNLQGIHPTSTVPWTVLTGFSPEEADSQGWEDSLQCPLAILLKSTIPKSSTYPPYLFSKYKLLKKDVDNRC
jgi:hypothetical protein